MKRALIVAAMVALLSSPAGPITGNQLHESCKTNVNYCLDFLNGATEMFIFQMSVRHRASLCQ